MSAVAPHLEESLTDRIEGPERTVFRLNRMSNGLSAGVIDPTEKPAAALEKDHQQLARGVALRQIGAKLLEGRELHVEIDGEGSAYVVITPPILPDEYPPWSSLPDPLEQYPLLTWTKKMQCPSFSLPAGALENGGSCPSAGLGQTTAPREKLVALGSKKRILELTIGPGVTLDQKSLPAFYALSVCETCYAESGSYQYVNNIIGQLAVFAWTQAAVEGGYFVRTMIEVIEKADYHLDKEVEGGGDPRVDLKFLRKSGWRRFFRWHDSGDVWSAEYAAQVKQICDHFNPRKSGKGTPTLFWMPTRAWASVGSSKWVAVNDDETSNLVIRPSAYNVNAPAPTPEAAGPGNQSGSTVISGAVADAFKNQGYFDFDCPAAMSKQTCRQAQCRACWLHPDKVINYRLH